MGLLVLFCKMHSPTWPVEGVQHIRVYCLSISAVSCNYNYYCCTAVSGMRNTYKILMGKSIGTKPSEITKCPEATVRSHV